MPEDEEKTRKAVEAASKLKEPEGMSKKGTSKKKTADGQSPSPSKQKAASPAQLARAPISQTKKTQAFPPVSAVFQESQKMKSAQQVIEPPPPGMPPAELAPVVVAPPLVAEQPMGPSFPYPPPSQTVQTFQEADPNLAKKYEQWRVEKEAEYMRKRTRVEKDEDFQTAM